MSYILDALKKSQQERELGQIPGLNSQLSARKRRKLSFWLSAIGGFTLAIALGAVALYLLLGKYKLEQSAVQVQALPASPILKQPAPLVAVAPIKPAPAPVQTVKVKPAPMPVPVRAQPAPEPDPPQASGREEEVAAMKRRYQEMLAAPKPIEPKSTTDKPAQPTAEYPALSSLPEELRAKVPTLNVMMIYADPDPAKSFALVNGSKLREGDSTLEGVRLEQIRADGLVLSIDGQQFMKRR